MSAAAQGGGKARVQERAVRDACLDQVVEPVVKQNLRVVDHDEVHTNEHLKHTLIEVEIDWSQGLRVSAGPVEHRFVSFTPDCQLHLEGTVAQAVVIYIVLERLRFARDVALDQGLYRPIGAIKQGLEGSEVRITTETLAQLQHSLYGGLTTIDDTHQVRAVHDRNTDVVEDEVENVLIEFPLLKQFDRRDAQTLAKDRSGIGREGAREGTAHIHLVTEH